MLRLALKRSSSLVSRRCLAAFASIESLPTLYFSPPSSGTESFEINKGVFGNYGKVRGFHTKPVKLEFRASLASQAKSALDDSWFGEEKVSSSAPPASSGEVNEEGLEIVKLGISQEIVSALASRGITKLFPIQRAVLEPAMKGRDMFGRARTGTGKTLAFGIPIIDKILQFNNKNGRGRNPLALVLAPTRELARQVEKEFRESAPSLDTICVYGGTSISQQMRALDYGIDIAVGTPGRIIDLLKRGSLNLSEVQFVVLDEADQMLAVGFVDDVETIFERLPQNRQTLLFSATMPSWIKNLMRNYLKDPLIIDLVGDSDKKLADGISLYSIASDMYAKASILGPLITEHAKGGKCIVFTQTKRDADRLANAMARSFKCEALHGDISQAARERTLSGFRNGHFNILVATDVAARGLDVPNVDLIVHYEIPNTPETFVHRSGRTGRAGKKGTAILIYTEDQIREVRIIERETGCRFTKLPRIAAEGADLDMLNCMGDGGRYGSFGGTRDRRNQLSGSGRYGGSGDYRSGRFGGFRNSRFNATEGHGGQIAGGSGRFGFDRSQPGNVSGSGFSGGSDRFSSFGDFGSGRPNRFGDNSRQKNAFGDLGSGRSAGFGNNYSRQNNGMTGDSKSDRFGPVGRGFGNDDSNFRRRQA